MIRFALAAAVLAAAPTVSSSAVGDPLQALQWQKRVLIVFAEQDGAALQEQTEFLLADREGLRERDLLVLAVIDDEVKPIYGTPPASVNADALRRDLNVERGVSFVAVLIGKDGGVKLRTERPVRRTELFGIIDAMPMRRGGD